MTEQEYLQRLREIPMRARERGLPGETPEQSARRQADMEHELTIDYRLGADFSIDKRKILLEINRQKDLNHKALSRRLRMHELTSEQYAREVQAQLQMCVEQLREVLDESQVEALLGIKPGESPWLPLDPGQIPRP